MEELRESLKKAVFETLGVDFEPEIALAPENVEADYSSNAPLRLAKEARKSPLMVAEALLPVVASGLEGVAEVSVSAPGFLNFKLTNAYLRGRVGVYAMHGAGASGGASSASSGGASGAYAGKTVVCEFSDPNPFKVLHVGHLYTSVVGEAISRLFEQAGARVVRANFGGDVGLHVAKTMYALRRRDFDKLTIETIAECYVEGTAAYDDDAEAKAEITALNKEIYKINAENIHEGEVAELYWKGRELSYEYFKDFYARIGVKFDRYYPESEVAGLGLKKVREELLAGVYEESDGAVIFDGEKYGLHTRVFINREGVPTYESKDVGLIFTKWADYHFDKSVVITGSEQLEYMKVVLKSVEQYAPELVASTAHLTHGLVKLPGNVKMSSRKGNFLKAVDVLEMVKDELLKQYNSEDERVMMAALKYAFLKYKMGGDIVFDPQESVKMTGASGPYLLYSAVRAMKILRSVEAGAGAREAKGAGEAKDAGEAGDYIYNIYERNLARQMARYKDVLDEAVKEMAPHKVANFLYETAQEFSRFYEQCPVVGATEEAERVQLVGAYYKVMEHGLRILGIEIPEEM